MMELTTKPEPQDSDLAVIDTEHPDAEILGAYERVRAHRVWAYSFDDLPDDVRPDQQIEDADDSIQNEEGSVYDNWATSPSGVAAQLSLILTFCSDRWVDRGLMEQGLYALYRHKAMLDGRDQTILIAAYELLHIEWEQALAVYERSEGHLASLLNFQKLAETEVFSARAVGRTSEFAGGLVEHIESLIGDLDDVAVLNTLMRTLAPDWTAYKRKAEIAIKEGMAGDAAPWLLRDVNFLSGQIVVPGEDAR